MPANIEIKARINDPERFKGLAARISDIQVEIIPQEDVFFHTAQGRLKLRILPHADAQLVYYTRPDAAGPKRSDYQIAEVRDAEGMKMLLGQVLGVRGVVRKTRHLYRVGQTRVHFDEVEGLGTFAELEVVLREGQSDADGLAIAADLMARLGINAGDLLEGAYMDLIDGNSAS